MRTTEEVMEPGALVSAPAATSGARGTREGAARGQRGLGEERGERREGNKEMFCYVMVLDCYVV